MEKLYTTEVLYRGGLGESLSFRIESIIYIDCMHCWRALSDKILVDKWNDNDKIEKKRTTKK